MNDTCIPTRRRRVLLGAAFVLLCVASGIAAGQIIKLEKLTDEQLGRLQKIALEKGSSIPVPAALVGALRLSPAQSAPVVRQVSFQADDGVKHGFARLNDETGYFLFRKSPTGLSAFHVDKDFQPVAAAHDFAGDRFIALPEKEARDELNGEIVAWSRVLSPRGVSMPAPGTRPKLPGNSPSPALPPSTSAPGGAMPAPGR